MNDETLTEFFDAIKADDVFLLTQMINQHPELANAVAPNGIPAIMVATYQQRGDVVKLLLSSGAKVDAGIAAAIGDVNRLSAALASDPSSLKSLSSDGWTPLHLAAFFGKKPAVEFLLQAGAPVLARSTNTMNNHPLHAAAAGSSREIVELLIQSGADVNATQAGGWTPLHAAAMKGDADLTKMLLEKGARVDVRADNGQSPLDLAMGHGYQQVVDLLMSS